MYIKYSFRIQAYPFYCTLLYEILTSFILQFDRPNSNQMQQAILLISLIVIMTLVLIGVNFYLLTLYTHRDDKGWVKKAPYKIIIILGLTLCQAVTLMIPMDVSNLSATMNYINLTEFWFFLYIIVLIFITLVLPYVIFLYETDDQKSLISRLLTAFCYLFLTLIISCMILFISYNFLKYVDLPVEEVTLDINQEYDEVTVPIPVSQQKIIETQTTFIIYSIALMSFFGWIFVVLFGGIGLFALPFDMINEFRMRPRARETKEMKKTRDQLAAVLKEMINEGDQLQNTNENLERNQEARCLQKFRGKRKIHRKINVFKAKYYAISSEFEIFHLELKLANANPIVPYLKLFLGIFFMITALLWLIQIVFGNIIKMYTGDQRPLIYLFNDLFVQLETADAGFISTFIFAYLTIYFLWCVQKGNIKFGMQIPFLCRFHPLKEHETWLNSFMFNVILLMIASVGIAQLCISSFPVYTRNTQIYTIFAVEVRYMHFYQVVYSSNAFSIALVAWSLITLVYLLVTCNRKPRYLKKIEQIRGRVPDIDFQ